MAKFGEFITVYNILPEVYECIENTLDKIVRKAAFDVAATAKKLAPVDTGFLKNSIYVETRNESTYEAATGKSAKKNADEEMLPEVEPPTRRHQAIVAVGAEYGLYVEMGSVHGPAQPYLTPAVEINRPVFEAALEKLELAMGMGIGIVDSSVESGE